VLLQQRANNKNNNNSNNWRPTDLNDVLLLLLLRWPPFCVFTGSLFSLSFLFLSLRRSRPQKVAAGTHNQRIHPKKVQQNERECESVYVCMGECGAVAVAVQQFRVHTNRNCSTQQQLHVHSTCFLRLSASPLPLYRTLSCYHSLRHSLTHTPTPTVAVLTHHL